MLRAEIQQSTGFDNHVSIFSASLRMIGICTFLADQFSRLCCFVRSFLFLSTVLALTASSCAQLESLSGRSTEDLVSWLRHDTERKQLIIFVHGFNSDKASAWGKFPELVMTDKDFDDHNVLLFGYPTRVLYQVNDIQHQGEYLASHLKEALSSHDSVTLVGHSMGGLVILNALLTLEQTDYLTLIDADLKVATFGTPYLGVEGTYLLPGNKQADGMKVLSNELGRLNESWKHRFNRKGAIGERETPTIPVLAFRGVRDNFVPQTSACGGPVTSCEMVDGDHISIVKPLTRDHLGYQKLKALTKKSKVQPTSKDRVGIWVSKIVGDDVSKRAQRTLIQRLEFYLLNESPLNEVVEVRELPALIRGDTFEEREREAKQVGKRYNASLVVSGQIGGLFKADEFEPRVTVVKPLGVVVATKPLATVHESQWLSSLPESTRLPPQPITEPVLLARFLAAVTFMEQHKWVEAARQLEQLLEKGASPALKMADIYMYLGYAYKSAGAIPPISDLEDKALKAFSKAASAYQSENDLDGRAGAENSLGLTYLALAQQEVDSIENLKRSVVAFQEASRRWIESQNWANDAGVKNNLGLAYRLLAQRGVETLHNLKNSAEVTQQAADRSKEQGNFGNFAMAKNNLGLTYRVLADFEAEPVQKLQDSAKALEEAADAWNKENNLRDFALAQNNLGLTYRVLAERGAEPEKNFTRSAEVLRTAAEIWYEQKDWAHYAMAHGNLGLTYLAFSRQHTEPRQYLTLGVEAQQEAARVWRERQDWVQFAAVQENLGLIYLVLAEREVEPVKNLKCSVKALQEAAPRFQSARHWPQYASTHNKLALAYLHLAELGVAWEHNLTRSAEAQGEAARAWKKAGDGTGYITSLIRQGIAYEKLSTKVSEPYMPLQLAKSTYQEVLDWARRANDTHLESRIIEELDRVVSALMSHGADIK